MTTGYLYRKGSVLVHGFQVQGHRVGVYMVFGEYLMIEIQNGKQVCAEGTREPEIDEKLQDWSGPVP